MRHRDDPTNWMWGEAFDLLAQAERMHRQFFRLTTTQRAQPQWEPPVDVFEDEHEIVIVVAMPGVPAERIEVTHESGVLVVRGERPLPFAGTRHRVRQLEIPYGRFERRVALGTPVASAASDLTHGVLVVRLAKS